MIKSLQHVSGWTFGPNTVGVTTVVVNDAWQFPKTDKADSSAPHAMKPREILAEYIVERASLCECH